MRYLLAIALLLAVLLVQVSAAEPCVERACFYLPLLIGAPPQPDPAPEPSATTATATTATATTATATTATATTATATATATATVTATTAASVSPTLPAPTSDPLTTFTQIQWITMTRQNGSALTYANGEIAVSEAQVATLFGKLFSFGGFNSSTGYRPYPNVYVFETVGERSGKFTRLTNMPAMDDGQSGGVTHAGFTSDARSIYWASGYHTNRGGNGQSYGSKQVWRYDPLADPLYPGSGAAAGSNPYSRLPDLPNATNIGGSDEPAAGQLAYVSYSKDGLAKRELYYIGGTSGGPRLYDLDVNWALDLDNPQAGWKNKAALPLARHHAASLVLDGKIYLIGGQQGHDGALTSRAEMHRYDPLTDTWTQLADLPSIVKDDPREQPNTSNQKGRNHHSSTTVVLGGRIIIMNGQGKQDVPTNDVIAYDPRTNTWTALTATPNARHSGIGAALDGKLYVGSGSYGGQQIWLGIPVLN